MPGKSSIFVNLDTNNIFSVSNGKNDKKNITGKLSSYWKSAIIEVDCLGKNVNNMRRNTFLNIAEEKCAQQLDKVKVINAEICDLINTYITHN